MQEIQIFNNEEFGEIRTVTVEGQAWFVGKDVADTLGYQNGSRDINRHVDEEDRQKVMIFDGNQDKETIIINESGLYSLILSRKLPTVIYQYILVFQLNLLNFLIVSFYLFRLISRNY